VFLADQLRRSADWYERLMLDLHTSEVAGNIDGVQSNVDLASIRVPTLVVWGERDSLFPVLHGEHVARSIPGARLEVLKGVGHCPHLETPELLAAAFRRFETGLSARAS
jgi:pimeloyl-ACP methyl ester carboxylesterase